MFCTQASRRADAERAASLVMVLDHGAFAHIKRAAAASGVSQGVLRWDAKDECYRINEPFTWADVDYLS